jgi:hypothetical protein
MLDKIQSFNSLVDLIENFSENLDNEYLDAYKIFKEYNDIEEKRNKGRISYDDYWNNRIPQQTWFDVQTEMRNILKKMANDAGYTTEVYKGWDQFKYGKANPIRTFKRSNESYYNTHRHDFMNPPIEEYKGIAGFFTDDRWLAGKFGKYVDKFYLKLNNPFVIEAERKAAGEFQYNKDDTRFRDAVKSGKYDSIILKNTADEGNVYISLNPNNIKILDITTFDENGDLILPSRRFNDKTDDINF